MKGKKHDLKPLIPEQQLDKLVTALANVRKAQKESDEQLAVSHRSISKSKAALKVAKAKIKITKRKKR